MARRWLGWRSPANEAAEPADQRSLRELLQATRMLTAGLAHELNNSLFVINGYAEMALEGEDLPPRLRRDLEEVLDSGQRAAGLVRQILAASRAGVGQRIPTRLPPLVKEVLKELVRGEETTVPSRHRLDDGDLALLARPWEVYSAVRRLCLAACCDADPQGCVLRVEADPLFEESGDEGVPAPGEYLRLRVGALAAGSTETFEDALPGPPLSARERTRAPLAQLCAAVEKLGGVVRACESSRAGRALEALLPAIRGLVTGELADGPIPRGSGRVMLAIEPAQRSLLLSGWLADQGFEARRAVEEHAGLEWSDALVADESPTGTALMRAAQDGAEGLPVILLAQDAEVVAPDGAGVVRVPLRPLSLRDLSAALLSVLGIEGEG